MPSWQPIWENVNFDFIAAEAAIADCRACRRILDQRDAVLRGPLQRGLAEWRGRSRASFDAAERQLRNRTNALIDHLWQAEHRLARTIDDAHEEQAHRVRNRERWNQENAAEIARAAQAQAAAKTAAKGTSLLAAPQYPSFSKS